MNYSDNLPRKVKTKSRCLALYDDGRMCMKTAQYEITLHNSHAIIDTPLRWARIFVCGEHIPCYEKSQVK